MTVKRKPIQLNPQTVGQVTFLWPQKPDKQLRDRESTWILLGNPLCVPIICTPVISPLRSLKHLSHLKSKIPLLKAGMHSNPISFSIMGTKMKLLLVLSLVTN